MTAFIFSLCLTSAPQFPDWPYEFTRCEYTTLAECEAVNEHCFKGWPLPINMETPVRRPE